MTPRRLITLILAAMLALALPAAGAAAQPPNVIVVLADDLGYGDLGAHGNPRLKTPNLDGLRQQSVRFIDFHVAPMCTPSRGELMTGRDAFRNGAVAVASGGSAIRRDLSLMPQFFKDNGYATAHFGKWHLGDDHPYRPQDRGFDTSLGYKGFGIDSVAGEWENDAFDDRYWRDGVLTRLPGYNTDVFFNEAMTWMGRQQRRRQPFFVYLAPTASHEPFYVASRYQKPYEDLGLVLSAFYGMTANLDENMGRLLAYLRRSGLADNTILVYLSDNGTVERTGFFNAGMRGRKNSLYDGGHRVPFFVRWPKGSLGTPRDIDALTHGTDLLPTLIELAGLRTQRATDFDGLSLAPLLRGQPDPQPQRKFVIQYGMDGPVFKEGEAAVLWQRWRLVKGQELYDTGADPAQQVDLAAQRPEIVQTLRAYYEQWLLSTRPLLNPATPVVVGAAAQPTTLLTSADWTGPWAGDFKELGRTSAKLFGHWPVQAAIDGRYELALYLFPPQANTPLDQSLRNIPARPVAAAELLVDGRLVSTAPAAKGATHLVFSQDWLAGDRHRIEGRFLDADGKALCGAFFIRVRRMP